MPSLSRHQVPGVRRSHHDRDLELLVDPLNDFCSMHLGSIYQPNGVISPASSLSIQVVDQLSNELSISLLVVVCLQESEICISEVINCSHHRNPRLEYVVDLTWLLLLFEPTLPLVVGLAEPGLIDSKDSLPINQQAQHLLAELLSHIQIPQRVGVSWHLVDLLVLEAVILL